MQTILVTGSTGFLGGHIVEELSKERYSLHLLIRHKSRLDRLSKLPSHVSVSRYSHYNEIENIIELVAPDIIIHTACNYGRNGEDLSELLMSNVFFGLQVLSGTLQLSKPVTFVNCGTVLDKGVSFYSLSKAHFCEWAAKITEQENNNINFLNLRLQHFYGPGDDESKFVSAVMAACLRGDPTIDLTSGSQVRDFIHVKDVVAAIRTVLSNITSLPRVQHIDVGSGIGVSIKELALMIHALTKSETTLNFGVLPMRSEEDNVEVADVGELKRLGWAPKISLESGLKEMVSIGGLS